MPNDLPDWSQNASVPGQTLTLPSASPTSTTLLALPNRAAAILLDVLTSTFNNITVTGQTSGEPYLSLSAPLVGPRAVVVTDSRDAQVIVSLAHTVGGAQDVVDVSFMPAAVIAMLSQGSVVDVTDRSGRILGNVQSIVNTVTVQEGAAPPLWQAPRTYVSAELNIVSSVVMVLGVAGQVLRVFGWDIEIDQAGGPSIGWLEDTVAAAGTVSARVAAFSSTGTSSGSGYEAGKPLTAGQGIRFNVPLLGAGGIVRAMVGYSLG